MDLCVIVSVYQSVCLVIKMTKTMKVCCVISVFAVFLGVLDSTNSSPLKYGTKVLREDPEIHMNTIDTSGEGKLIFQKTVTQLITSKGYPCEDHDVHTKDGYILGVQRIPRGVTTRGRSTENKKPVVLLQHGLLSCSACWVENLANNSLGFMLADAGFDVWLGNSRGNTYSKRHKKLKPDEKEFWEFSWDEMAQYDVPATVDKILSVTGATQISYVGHSQGCEIAIAQLSRDPSLSSKIKIFVGLAPATYLGDVKSPFRYLAPYSKDLVKIYDLLGGDGEFLPDYGIFHSLAMDLCLRKGFPRIVCENVLFLLGGYDISQMNVSRVPVYVAQHPAGTSIQNLVHYAQSVESKLYQMFDFGPEENMKKYNQTTPPQYYPGNITIPVALYSGTADWLVTPSEMKILTPQIKHLVKSKVIDEWEHLDFIWALDAPKLLYNELIELLKKTF